MKSLNRTQTAPVAVPRTNRNHQLRVLTSVQAGKMMPVAAIPLLREDAARGRLDLALEMHETTEILMNGVVCTVSAYLVPFLALDRFEGSMDQFNRSYMGQKKTDDVGASVVPFLEGEPFGTFGSNVVYKYLGLHGASGDVVNTAYLEAYNKVWNFRAKNRSPSIEQRDRLDATLAPAFWPASRFEHVVPDFDQAVIDGEVALSTVGGKYPVKGLGVVNNAVPASGSFDIKTAAGAQTVSPYYVTNNAPLVVDATPEGVPDVFVELQAGGLNISLSNLELAKKTQAFAKLRERYSKHDDEWIIDMLMDGLTIPDQALKQPILLSQQQVGVRQAKRYATDSGNLSQSVTSGFANVSIPLRVPKLHTGGVILVVVECVPEQLFERQQDPFFHTTDVEKLPEFLRDYLDPEKVDVVLNKEIDTSHATPGGVFGYAPLNWRWNSMSPRVGGKFVRPTANTPTDTARQRLWAVETVNPQLSQNFYVVSDIHVKPFVDQTQDPFDVTAAGNVVINGNTVFGGVLHEAVAGVSNYDEVIAKAPQERITK